MNMYCACLVGMSTSIKVAADQGFQIAEFIVFHSFALFILAVIWCAIRGFNPLKMLPNHAKQNFLAIRHRIAKFHAIMRSRVYGSNLASHGHRADSPPLHLSYELHDAWRANHRSWNTWHGHLLQRCHHNSLLTVKGYWRSRGWRRVARGGWRRLKAARPYSCTHPGHYSSFLLSVKLRPKSYTNTDNPLLSRDWWSLPGVCLHLDWILDSGQAFAFHNLHGGNAPDYGRGRHFRLVCRYEWNSWSVVCLGKLCLAAQLPQHSLRLLRRSDSVPHGSQRDWAHSNHRNLTHCLLSRSPQVQAGEVDACWEWWGNHHGRR